MLALAGVSALGSAAVHMLVPALPTLARDFAITPRAAQYAISVFLFGLAAGQLVGGPWADRIGRRPMLLCGLALYLVGATLAAGAEGMTTMCLARAIQGIGAGVALVSARVIVADSYSKREAGRGQARLMSVVLASTALSPAIGGLISGTLGWRAVPVVQAAISIVPLALLWKSLPETLAPSARAATKVTARYGRLLRNAAFVRTAVAVALASSAMYMFLAVAPFLLVDQWGSSPARAGLYFLMTAVTAIIGTRFVGWLEHRVDTFRLGLAVCFAGTVLTLAAALLAPPHWAALTVPMMIVTFGVGIAGPSGTARVLHSEEGLAGTATSLAGALQMAAGGAAASLLGALASPSFTVLAAAMICAVGLAWRMAPR